MKVLNFVKISSLFCLTKIVEHYRKNNEVLIANLVWLKSGGVLLKTFLPSEILKLGPLELFEKMVSDRKQYSKSSFCVT